jgi:hypothetical protein
LTTLLWRLVSLSIVLVLVLSEAVLVIAIDLSIILCARLANTIEFHRPSSQHRDASKERAT